MAHRDDLAGVLGGRPVFRVNIELAVIAGDIAARPVPPAAAFHGNHATAFPGRFALGMGSDSRNNGVIHSEPPGVIL